MDCIGSSIFYEKPGIESYTNTKEEICEHSPSLQSDDNNQPFVFVTICPERQNNICMIPMTPSMAIMHQTRAAA